MEHPNDVWMICAKCGRNDMFEYELHDEWIDDGDNPIRPGVALICGNCSNVCGLESVAEERRADSEEE